MDGNKRPFSCQLILAEQHYEFHYNVCGLSITIGLLSRFVGTRRTIEKLRKGAVDIVIGTHRLLKKTYSFKTPVPSFNALVKHKERLKQLKSQVDSVLTLTAAQFEQLHMSMRPRCVIYIILRHHQQTVIRFKPS